MSQQKRGDGNQYCHVINNDLKFCTFSNFRELAHFYCMADLISQRNHRRAHGNKRRHVRKPVKSRFKRFIIRAFWGGLALCLLGGVAGWLIFVYAIERPYKDWAEQFDLERINDLEKPSIIYDRNGLEIGRIYVENRSYVPLSKVSTTMVNALIAQEDSRFREHPGYDILGMARAVRELYQAGGRANQGASTLTQQLARNAYGLQEHANARGEGKYGRKIVEIYLAQRITDRYSKDQVLEFYLNRVYLGSGFYGIRAASLGYFGKEPIDLTTREAASIAALIKNPNALSPLKDAKENRRWRDHVLRRMAKEGYISQAEADRLVAMPLELNPKPLKRNVSHIYARVAKEVIAYLGEDRVNASGLKIYTTLDKHIQDAANDALVRQMNAIEQRPDFKHPRLADYKPESGDKPNYVDGSVLVVENSTGAILAYVGGRDFSKRNFDSIEEGARPPGTSILPFLYATAFDSGYSPAHKLLDDAIDNRLVGIGGEEGILGEWGVETIKDRYEGEITARKALSQSKIAASLRLGMSLTTKPFIDKLEKFGIRKPDRESGTEVNPVYRPRIFVGTEPISLKEMTLAFTAFPNGGERPNEIYFLDRIEDENGQVLKESSQALGDRKRTASTTSSTAYQVHTIMQDSLREGSAQRVAAMMPPEFKGAVKTGTNYNFSDNTMFGYNSAVTCGIWIGFTDGNKAIYPNAFSSDTCGPILATTIGAALKNFPAKEIETPASVESVEICLTSGKRATRNCYELDPSSKGQTPKYIRNTYTEYLRKGDMSLAACDIHGDDSADIRSLLSPSGQAGEARILPVIPILPLKPALIGKDPYFTEQAVAVTPRSFELLPTGDDPALEAQPIEEDDTYGQGEMSIPLPPPNPIDFTLPELKSL